ncbi:MAG: GNAT family N-acetyltransferase [Clostridia bacterium]|nr:GNAT family N-acetyltransferase [Clostridia bacterium]
MSDYIHMTHGKAHQREALLDLLDTTFGFNEEGNKFINLLPKLYKEQYHPAENNIILDVDGDMRAAVGLYYNTLTVGDEKLKIGGIGNVAVHPDHRGKGYMQFCMLLALDEMKQNMTDLSCLGGARQRYEHFSYQPAGINTSFNYRKDNVKRTLGSDRKSAYTIKKLEETDTQYIREITEIYNSRIFRTERPEEAMFDILHSWNTVPYVALHNGEVKGWFAYYSDKSGLHELFCKNEEDIEDVILLALENSGNEFIKINVPQFDKPLYNYLALNCEFYDIGHAEHFTIFCYENVIRAFLKLKTTYQNLPDGELKVFIQGEKLPEQLKITVKDNIVSVEETDEKPDIVLKHLEAMRFFGSHYSERRQEAPAFCNAWFPLPLYGYGLDNV